MKRWISLVVLMTLLPLSFYGQKEWDIDKTENGSVTVKSRIYKVKNEGKKEYQMVEYEVSTIAEVTYDKCLEVMRDVSTHTEFLNYTEISEKVKTLSNNKWVIYYFFDAPWPMPNSDSVVLMEFSEDSEKKQAVFAGQAQPDLYEMKDVERTTLNDIRYEFTQMEGGKVEIRIISVFSPTTMAPNWLAKTYFPDGPTEMVTKFIALAKS